MRIQFKDVIQCYSEVIEYFAEHWGKYLEITFQRFPIKLTIIYAFILSLFKSPTYL